MTRAKDMADGEYNVFAADEISGDKVSGGTIGAGTLGSSVVFPAGHVIQTKSSIYSSSQIACGTTATSITQGELSNFTPILGTSGKLLVWWWISGIYTTTSSIGVHIGLKYSTDDFSSETTLGANWPMSAYTGYGQGTRKGSGHSASTGLISTPTASEFDVRFHVQAAPSGSLNINQDGTMDTMGIIIQEISP